VAALAKTRIIKVPRRDPGPPHAAVAGGYGHVGYCAFVRPDGHPCGLSTTPGHHTLVLREKHHAQKSGADDGTGEGVKLDDSSFAHWCQAGPYMFAAGLAPRVLPCIYCGVPLVRVGSEWWYEDSDQLTLMEAV
jgi:hypothetical protein